MTREEVDPNILILNKSLKYATQDYLLNNPWAFERVYGETVDDIKIWEEKGYLRAITLSPELQKKQLTFQYFHPFRDISVKLNIRKKDTLKV